MANPTGSSAVGALDFTVTFARLWLRASLTLTTFSVSVNGVATGRTIGVAVGVATGVVDPVLLVVADGNSAFSKPESGQLGSVGFVAHAPAWPTRRSTAVSWLSSSGGTTPLPTASIWPASVLRTPVASAGPVSE